MVKLDASQQTALNNIVNNNNRVMILTAGPGSGKSFTTKYIAEYLWHNNIITNDKTYFTAPTGKAAKVLDEYLDDINPVNKPQTIHRLLGCKGPGRWEYNRENKLDAEFVFVDESSMIDSEIMARLLSSVNQKARFILIGDKNQLNPVGPGCPFADLINLKDGTPTVNYLTENHRAKEGGLIAHNTDLIKRGHPLIFGKPGQYTLGGKRPDDLFHIEIDDKEYIATKIVDICRKWEENNEDYQVLAPQHSGACGIKSINEYMQTELNPAPKTAIKLMNGVIGVGDKVINKKNNYKHNIFNGYIGRVLEIDTYNRSMVIDFDGQVVTLSESEDLKNIELSYCVSIHKSQGSEYKRGVLVIHTSHSFMLSKPLLYVGVSRFKEELHIVGDRKAITRALKKNMANKRQTYLSLQGNE